MDLPLSRTLPMESREREVSAPRRLRLKEDAPLILHVDPPSFVAEQYRSLAVQIEERIHPADSPGRLGYALTVTSPGEGDGKTLTSLNLALTLTRGEERRVLLIEGDLWRPRLAEYFVDPSPRLPGLQQVLEGEISLPDAVLSVEGVSLEVLLAGSEKSVGDRMSGRRMSEVLAEARGAYEIIVIDSPPMDLLASSRALATRSDGVVLVIRANHTKKRGIEKTLATLGPEKVIGIVLNGLRISRRGYRGYD
jgi:protein-tyrosine kinase